jgi:hypothetical protein
LRKDVDALLSVLDHWVTSGTGNKQRQFEYTVEALEAHGKRGISGHTYVPLASSTAGINFNLQGYRWNANATATMSTWTPATTSPTMAKAPPTDLPVARTARTPAGGTSSSTGTTYSALAPPNYETQAPARNLLQAFFTDLFSRF